MNRETDKTAGHVVVSYSPVEREPLAITSSRVVMKEEARVEPRTSMKWRNRKKQCPTAGKGAVPNSRQRSSANCSPRAQPTAGEKKQERSKTVDTIPRSSSRIRSPSSEVRNVRDETEWCTEREETVFKNVKNKKRCEHSVGHCRDQHMKSRLKPERPRGEVLEWSSCRHWYTVQQGQADVPGQIANTVACEGAQGYRWERRKIRPHGAVKSRHAEWILTRCKVRRFVDRNTETDSDQFQFMRSRVPCSHG